MSDYAALLFDDLNPRAAEAAQRRLEEAGWRVAHESSGCRVLCAGGRALPIWASADQSTLIVGDLFAAPRLDPADTTEAFCQRLLAQTWGRYIVIARDQAGSLTGVFRDPSSTLDAVIWRQEEYCLVASEFPVALGDLGRNLTIDWETIGASLVDPLVLASACGIKGMETVTPGALRTFDGKTSVEKLLWFPADFARLRRNDDAGTRADLVGAIDRCIEMLCGLGGDVIAEVSGGLDSSIVASALARAPSARVVQWLHFYIDDPAGDERPYAQAMAGMLGVKLTQARKPPGRLDHDAIADFAFGAKPSWRVIDGAYDREMAERVTAMRASRIMTGLGGDTVFMQGADPWLAGDALACGRGSWLPRVARFSKRSVYGIAREALLEAMGVQPPLIPARAPWLSAAALKAGRRARRHPWLDDLAGVSAPKRQQILGLAHTLMIHGRSRRTTVADVESPLMCQPVMELCLSLSAIDQTRGGDDRAMARAAFSDRLPPEIQGRRSKAGYGAYYGKMVAQDLPALRELLLDGMITSAGLVDRAGLDRLLSPDTLVRQGPYREILNLVVLEHWARSWRDLCAGGRIHGRGPRESLIEESQGFSI